MKNNGQSGTKSEFQTFLNLVGNLNYTWTNTESLLIHMIAGLARVNKDVATVIFLTLNTSRARIDLVERLAKMEGTDDALKKDVLKLTKAMHSTLKLKKQIQSLHLFFRQRGTERVNDSHAHQRSQGRHRIWKVQPDQQSRDLAGEGNNSEDSGRQQRPLDFF